MPPFDFWAFMIVPIAFAAFIVGLAIGEDGQPSHPFTPSGRAAWRYSREVSRRAARLIALGVEPDDARRAARAEMRGEANETLKAEGAIKELLR